ncbi:MAG: YHYH protein [Anaerolineales bacterium]|nr:YHYH protein [Anaerolineales bacterium]
MKRSTKLLLLTLLLLTALGCAPPGGGPPPNGGPPPQNGAGQPPQGNQNRPQPQNNQPPPAQAPSNQPEQPAQQPAAAAQQTSGSSAATVADTAASITANLNGCAAEHFIAVQPHPNNSAYPDPQLNVSCNGTEVTIQTNNIPNFEFVPLTPNNLAAQNFTFTIPQNPTKATRFTDVPLGGPSAVAVNGLVIFGPTEAPNDGYRDPYLDNILDYCNGHTAPGGIYHFHARPDCIYTNIDGNVGLVLGYAFDGYPILAPYICADANCTSVKEVQSSWQLTNPEVNNAWEKHSYIEGLSELDQCNGMEFADGSYAYFATDSFPYFMGCYRGVVNQRNIRP